MMHKRITAGLLIATALAACSKQAPEPSPPEENVSVAPAPLPEAPPAPEPPATNLSIANQVAPPPAAPVPPQAQMSDDADATGLTARLPASDEGDAVPAGDNAQ